MRQTLAITKRFLVKVLNHSSKPYFLSDNIELWFNCFLGFFYEIYSMILMIEKVLNHSLKTLKDAKN